MSVNAIPIGLLAVILPVAVPIVNYVTAGEAFIFAGLKVSMCAISSSTSYLLYTIFESTPPFAGTTKPFASRAIIVPSLITIEASKAFEYSKTGR